MPKVRGQGPSRRKQTPQLSLDSTRPSLLSRSAASWGLALSDPGGGEDASKAYGGRRDFRKERRRADIPGLR